MKEILVFEKEYDSEELCDVQRDVMESFDMKFNSAVKDIKVDDMGFSDGIYHVKIVYAED